MSVTIIRNKPGSALFAIFGSGLIGGEVISTASILCAGSETEKISFDWDNLNSIEVGISSLLEISHTENVKRLEVFWCAGRAGFSATVEDMQQEQLSYQATISRLEKVQDIEICFNLLSSAGGLYEGLSCQVNQDTSPVPLRPYGEYKLEQERILHASKLLHRIYRPTTVYGRAREGVRSGLISTLISNTFKQLPTTIHASPNTMRDYIYVRDVSKLMIQNALFRSETGKAVIVASGRPVSIYYLLEKVRLALSKRPRVNFIPSLGNDQNMSFSGIVNPSLASLTSLEEGIRLLARQQWLVKV